MRILSLILAVYAVVFLSLSSAFSDEAPYDPKVAPASNEGELAIQGFKVPDGMWASVFAAEPMIANPVAFCIDERGNLYVAETFRQSKGVEDNRSHMNWLHDDLALQTVEDRLEMFKKYLGDKVADYALEHDRIRYVEDRDGDGKADEATIFADGFNGILDGTGAGVLARHGKVYYTCIPELWQLEDTDGDHKADIRTSLHHGYGVRVAFRGHDSHGLIFGPDGKLYFSIGDRGYNIKTDDGRHLVRPYTGAVFRCNPDGTDLEEFAYGLRNPQELAFDDFGNLFTGDNNSDSGDKARWVHVVEGGDTGWRMYYQYLQDRGPWNRERLWDPAFKGQAAYIIPPVTHLGDGPSGLVAYPGVGLPERYQGHFFLCDFRGGAVNSGVRSFAVKPKGASFELVDSHQFVWSILATDVAFGYDGSMYVSDWVNGWEGLGKGRVYKFTDEKFADVPASRSAVTLMREGLEAQTDQQLAELLTHADRRIRQEAQFALVDRSAVKTLSQVAVNSQHQLARLHAIWGVGQLGRQDASSMDAIVALLEDRDAEVRAQTVKVLGEGHAVDSADRMAALLADTSARVRYFATLSLGKLGQASSVEPILDMLSANNDEDPVLRHAGVLALVRIGDLETLEQAAKHPSRSVRMSVLLAYRRLGRPEIAGFLTDAEPDLIVEAARAINDEPIDEATADLAALAGRAGLSDPLLRRVLNANFRLGQEEHAVAVARIAGDSSVADVLRLEAIAELTDWGTPSPLDRVLGRWRPLDERSDDFVAEAIRPSLGGIFSGSNAVREAGTKLAAKYGIKEIGPLLLTMLADGERPGRVRVAALNGLATLESDQLADAMRLALDADDPLVRVAGREVFARLEPAAAVNALADALENATTVEKQGAIRVLADLQTEPADAVLLNWMERLIDGRAPAEIALDLLEAARSRKVPAFESALETFTAKRSPGDHLAEYRESLAGGDAERGKAIFYGRSEVSCRRCHKIQGEGGEVGPDLSKLGREKPRAYLLESIVQPNRQIAKGFETAIVAMDDGKVYVGVVKKDDAETLQLMTADGSLITVNKDEIDDRATGKSAMPEELVKHLTKSDVRDLVEFLVSPSATKAGGHE